MSVLDIARSVRDLRRACSPAAGGILVVAHRGVWANAPENSLKSIRDAFAMGVDMVEIDAQGSSDGTMVVVHDATLDRTTQDTGVVLSRHVRELTRLRLRAGEGGPDAALTDERLPTLAEALEEARGRVFVNVDTKFERDLPAVARVILDLRMADEVVVKAKIDPRAGRFAVEDLPIFGKIPFMPIVDLRLGAASRDIAGLARLDPVMVECDFTDLAALREFAEVARRDDTRLWVNSLDVAHSLDFNDTRALGTPDAVWGELIAQGTGAIQTDKPAELIAWLIARGHRNA